MHDVYLKMAQDSTRQCLGKRRLTPYGNYESKYYFYSVQTCLKKAERIGSALTTLKLTEQKDFEDYKLRTVGFYSSNNVNYFIADMACGMYNFASVPIYDTHGEEGTKHVFQ